MGTQSRFNKRR